MTFDIWPDGHFFWLQEKYHKSVPLLEG